MNWIVCTESISAFSDVVILFAIIVAVWQIYRFSHDLRHISKKMDDIIKVIMEMKNEPAK